MLQVTIAHPHIGTIVINCQTCSGKAPSGTYTATVPTPEDVAAAVTKAADAFVDLLPREDRKEADTP